MTGKPRVLRDARQICAMACFALGDYDTAAAILAGKHDNGAAVMIAIRSIEAEQIRCAAEARLALQGDLHARLADRVAAAIME